MLSLEPSELTSLELLSQTLALGSLEFLLLLSTELGLGALLLDEDGLGSLLALLDNCTARQDVLVFLLGTGLGPGESGGLCLLSGLDEGRIDIGAGEVKRLSETRELRADDFGWSALELLDTLLVGRGTRRESLGRREDIGLKGEDTGRVVDADRQLSLLAAVHDELLDSGGADVEWWGERSELDDKVEGDGLVDLRELLEQTSKDDLVKRSDIALHLLIGSNLSKNGGNLPADAERMEVNLKNGEELTDLRAGALEEATAENLLEEAATGRGLGHTQKVGEPGVLVPLGLVNVEEEAAGARGADDGNGEGAEDDEGGSTLDLSLVDGRSILLGNGVGSNLGGAGPEKVVVPVPGSGVEEEVLGDEEDTGKLLVVVGHHNWLWWALAQVEESVDILDRAESLLPELELDSDVQLLEAGVEMPLKSIGVVEVDGVHLGRVLGRILDVVAEKLAEAAELSLPGVLQAKVESLKGGLLVHDLKARIVAKNIEDGPVCLPQKLQPWRNNGPVRPVLGLLAGNTGEQDGLWSLGGLQIVDIVDVDLLGLGLGVGDLRFREFDELLEDKLKLHQHPFHALIPSQTNLDSLNTGVLGDVLVLVKTLLRILSFSEIDAKFDEKDHHRFEGGDRSTPGALGGNMLVKQLKSGLGLLNPDQLLGPLEDVLRLCVRGRRHVCDTALVRGPSALRFPNSGRISRSEGQRFDVPVYTK